MTDFKKSDRIRALGCMINNNRFDGAWEEARKQLMIELTDYDGKYRKTTTPAGDGVAYIPCMIDRHVVAVVAWDIADELEARGE